ncbi:hypothetical protein NMY22_g4834 [Coprinellus aureogranulatus]|nr:hypothetical protein NMY22_g4834 [Coprinellus aureogranulatus]
MALRPTNALAYSVTASPVNVSTADLRLRLMTLLAMYDLLPYSISHPPNVEEPLDLGSAIDARAVHQCLEAMAQQGKITPQEARSLSAVYNDTIQNRAMDVQTKT